MNELTPEQEDLIKKIWNPNKTLLLLSKPISQDLINKLWREVDGYGKPPLVVTQPYLAKMESIDEVGAEYLIAELIQKQVAVYGSVVVESILGDPYDAYFLNKVRTVGNSTFYSFTKNELDSLDLVQAIYTTRQIIKEHGINTCRA